MSALTPIRVPEAFARRHKLMGRDQVVVCAMPGGDKHEVAMFVCHPRYAHLPVSKATHRTMGVSLMVLVCWVRAAQYAAQAQVAA